MRIKLFGALPEELRDMGFKHGDKVDAFPLEGSKIGTMQFKVWVDGQVQLASVSEQNYKKL
jgi:hypothetical protein